MTGICLLGGLLSWRVLVVGLADYYAADQTPAAAASTLRWRPDAPEALRRRRQAFAQSAPAVAGPLLQASVWANPTNPRPYLALARVWAGAGRVPEAIALVEVADTLAPMSPPALAESAWFWFERGRPERGLERWSALLRNSPTSAGELYPRLLRLADMAAARPLFLPLLRQPPDWWEAFFVYAAAHAPRPETVTFLYEGRNRGGALPSAAEQRAYLNRLWKDSRWSEAYLAWLGGLDADAQRGLGQVYDGGFDLPITGVGFDWRIAKARGVTVETIDTYGSRGQALHLVFDGRGERFQHVSQPLYLEPGRYQLQGRVRTDGLSSRQGLIWAVRCQRPDAEPLGASESFSGKDDWQLFSFEFQVPQADCPLQWLRLEQDQSPGTVGEALGGGIWFDDLVISRRG
ncbi:hypothetical protein [uncultured Thiodictyon sp.]|uniref:tetratricopeptide repeat protein n=1 Tax=uncultured Thiodictyon sp. TaxID=1846217 RepID=UPI0025FD19BB|nr:hypothetical protein [uncultured Thiodictyon sp.]